MSGFPSNRTRGGLLLGLCLLSSAAPLYAACPELGFPLRGSRVTAPGDTPMLALLQQNDENLRTLVDGEFWIDSPLETNGTEYIYLPPRNDGAGHELCFYPAFRHSAQGRHGLELLALDEADRDSLRILERLNDAGRDWHGGNAEGHIRAAETYHALARQETGFADLDFYLNLYAVVADTTIGAYPDAAPNLERLLATSAGHEHEFLVYWAKGQIENRNNDPDAAIDSLLTALALLDRTAGARDRSLDRDKGSITNLLGLMYIYKQQTPQARERFSEAIALARPDARILGRIYSNLGYSYKNLAQQPHAEEAEAEALLDQTEKEYLRARLYERSAGDYETLVLIENNLAVLYQGRGYTRKALLHYHEALKLLEEHDLLRARAVVFGNLWTTFSNLGEYQKAASYLEQAIALTENSSDRFLMISHCRLGNTHRFLEDYARAVAEHEQCLRHAAKVANSGDQQAEAWMELSRDQLAAGDTGAAAASIEAALAHVPQLRNQYVRPRLLSQYASVLLEQGRLQDARDNIELALRETDAERYPEEQIDALTLALRIYSALELPAEAITAGESAVATIESLYTQLEAEKLGPAWSDRTHRTFVLLVDILIDEYLRNGDGGTLARAFSTLERSRAISLRQQLATRLPEDAPEREERQQLALISEISSALTGTGDAAIGPNAIRENYYHQQNLLSLTRLAELDSLPIPAPSGPDQIRQRLAPGQLALSYFNDGDNVYLFRVDAEGISLRSLGPARRLDALTEKLQGSIDRPGASDYRLLSELSRFLLPADAALDGADELLIVPHSKLYSFPFPALSLGDEGEYRPLIASHAIKVLPSLSSYFMDKHGRSGEDGADIAAIADPVFQASQLDKTLNLFAGVRDELRGWSEELAPLPYTGIEVDNLEKIFPDLEILKYTGVRASRAALTGAGARHARILHIATHGYFRSRDDDNIGLALSVVDEEGNSDPGFITLSELFGYSYNNRLVVISGCETGMGMEQAGVGLNSLSRGFIAQGASHVISTLWPVSDRASAEFMRLFYMNLKRTNHVAEALKAAQLELQQSELYSEPFYWAPYVLTTISQDQAILQDG